MKPKLIDTHAHVNFNAYKQDGDKVIEKALDNGIWMINVGAQYTSSRRAIEYAEKYDQGVYVAAGLHPSHVYKNTQKPKEWEESQDREYEEFNEKKYQKLLENKKCIAMGEIGLDYYEGIQEEEKDVQKEVFLRQLDLAQQMGKPVALHCRKAYDDLIALLAMFNSGCANCPMSCNAGAGLRGVAHCFVGRWPQAEQLLNMGFYLAFNGIITYARDYDKVIKNTPLDKILLETDSPYLTPEPYRGQRNEPIYLKYVAQKIAEIKEIEFKKVAEQTTKNARELFNI